MERERLCVWERENQRDSKREKEIERDRSSDRPMLSHSMHPPQALTEQGTLSLIDRISDLGVALQPSGAARVPTFWHLTTIQGFVYNSKICWSNSVEAQDFCKIPNDESICVEITWICTENY